MAGPETDREQRSDPVLIVVQLGYERTAYERTPEEAA